MFNIDFYRTAQGFSDIENFLDDLEKRAATNKDARIQHKQVAQYIQFLADHGTRLGENITKHLDDDIGAHEMAESIVPLAAVMSQNE